MTMMMMMVANGSVAEDIIGLLNIRNRDLDQQQEQGLQKNLSSPGLLRSLSLRTETVPNQVRFVHFTVSVRSQHRDQGQSPLDQHK